MHKNMNESIFDELVKSLNDLFTNGIDPFLKSKQAGDYHWETTYISDF